MQPKESDKNTPNKDIKADNELVRRLAEEKYKYGFTTNVHTDIIDRGLTEDTVRLISRKKGEPDWLLEFRLKAYRHWLTMDMPTWAHLRIPEIDYQGISYYADPTAKKEGPKSMDEVDPELIKTFNKLGIPLEEQMALSGMAVDAVMDSVSVKTTFKETLMEKGLCLRQGSKGEPGKEAVELPVAENRIDALQVIRSERAQHKALCDNPAHFGKIIAETFVSHTTASGIIMETHGRLVNFVLNQGRAQPGAFCVQHLLLFLCKDKLLFTEAAAKADHCPFFNNRAGEHLKQRSEGGKGERPCR